MNDDDNEETDPMIVMRDTRTRGYAATCIEKKGVNPFNIKFSVGYLRELVWKRCVFKSEFALVNLKTATNENIGDGCELVPEEVPVGDHSKNGEAENAVKEVKRAARTNKANLEERPGIAIERSHPILKWLPR